MFKKLKIPAWLVASAGVRRMTSVEARNSGLVAPARCNLAGLMFPNVNIKTGEMITFRLRRDKPEIKDGKPQAKYMCPKGRRRGLYFPPDADIKLDDHTVPIVLVEAEKSSLALTAWSTRVGFEILPLAMGGCWGWRQNNGEDKESTPLSDLDVCNDRTVYILLDANAATNIQVQAARDALTTELVKRNCTVLIGSLSSEKGVNGPTT
jgi:hypothetical protein